MYKKLLIILNILISSLCYSLSISESVYTCSCGDNRVYIDYPSRNEMVVSTLPYRYEVFHNEYTDIKLNSDKIVLLYISDGDKLICENKVFTYRTYIKNNNEVISGWVDNNGRYSQYSIPANKSFFLFSIYGCSIKLVS